MYAQHFGLNILPFENVPDPAFFFNQGEHSRIRNRITESLKAGRGLIVVSGPMGSGKTTLSQMLISDFTDEIKLVWMAMPPDDSMDLFLFIAQELDLSPSSAERTFVLRDIRESLLQRHSSGQKCVIIVDESHLMSDDVINGLRLLNNLEHGSVKLVQLLLLGQEELLKIINRPELEPFKQRIATLEILDRMNPARIREYISHRIKVAGGHSTIFTETGWEALTRAFVGGSTPRAINSLCDRTLSIAFDKDKKHADVDDVYEAAEGMGLQKDVFFYKIELKQGVKINRDQSAVDEEDGTAENAPQGEKTVENGGETSTPPSREEPAKPSRILWEGDQGAEGEEEAAGNDVTEAEEPEGKPETTADDHEREAYADYADEPQPAARQQTPQPRLVKPRAGRNKRDQLRIFFEEDPEKSSYFLLISSLVALGLSIYFYLQVAG